MERRDHEQERDDRPEDDQVAEQEPDVARTRRPGGPRSETLPSTVSHGNVHQGWTTAQKSAEKRKPHARSENWSRPARSARSAMRMYAAYATAVTRQAATPTPVERHPAGEVDDEREAGEREGDREPEPAAHRLLHDEARPEGDEDRREVLDDERDPDVEPLDRDEVEELDERESRHAEDARKASSRHPATRSDEGRTIATAPMRMSAAPVARTSARRIAERPADSSTTFETVAFTAQRATADQTSANPSSGCGVSGFASAGSGWSGVSTTAAEPTVRPA